MLRSSAVHLHLSQEEDPPTPLPTHTHWLRWRKDNTLDLSVSSSDTIMGWAPNCSTAFSCATNKLCSDALYTQLFNYQWGTDLKFKIKQYSDKSWTKRWIFNHQREILDVSNPLKWDLTMCFQSCVSRRRLDTSVCQLERRLIRCELTGFFLVRLMFITSLQMWLSEQRNTCGELIRTFSPHCV